MPRVRLDDERGSLVLALLVAILAMTLGAAALASARMAERSVRRDMNYATVVHAADAGVQHALSILNQNLPLSAQVTPVSVGDQSFTYTVTPVSGGAGAYEVRSTGVAADGEQRVVVARLEQETRFPYALFTNQSIVFRGDNEVDSYDSEAICVVLPACAWADPYDGAGTVATNNDLSYIGNAVSDRSVLFDWESDPDAARCRRQPSANAQPVTCEDEGLAVDTRDERLDLTTAEELNFITEMEEVCDARHGVNNWPNWTANNGTSLPRVLTPPADFSQDFICVDQLTFDVDTVLAPLGPDLDIRPVVMVVQGDISFGDTGAGPNVNCVGTCEDDTSVQFPRHLQIYSATTGDVNVGPQSEIAAVVYAPRKTCQPDGAANVDWFGAIVCDGITEVGTWELHYDRALQGLGTGRYRVAEWREEPAP